MKKNILYLGLGLILVAALVLPSCSKNSTTATTNVITTATTTNSTTTTTTNVTTTKATTTAASTAAASTPQYGGTLTVAVWNSNGSNPRFNPMPFPWFTMYESPFLEWLAAGDIDTYGPRGNNQYSFAIPQAIPEQYTTGLLAESWEVTTNPVQFTFHLRHGVMWTGNQNIGMAPREVIASDVVYCVKRCIDTPGPGGTLGFVSDVSAPDNYTVVYTLNRYEADWLFYIGDGMGMGLIYPPEWVTAGTEDWHNAVGSGPFILTDYVASSGATYTRNPSYWGKTTVNGKEYQLPFVSTLNLPIIADESTQIAALRTGKIDWNPYVKAQYQSTLSQTSPDLIVNTYSSGTIDMFEFNRLNSKYFSNKNIRRALMIGTDLQTIAKMVYNGGIYYAYPFAPGTPAFIPLDQLPASQKELWTYDPTTAKQMIADAGYPSGFNCVLNITGNSADLAQACVDMWTKIGIKATIQINDQATDASISQNMTFTDIIATSGGTMVDPIITMRMIIGNPGMMYAVGDPLGFDAQQSAIGATIDAATRTTLEQKLGLAIEDDVPFLPFAMANSLDCYWSWVKNYYGEVDTGWFNQQPIINRIWIDQNLKKSLGK